MLVADHRHEHHDRAVVDELVEGLGWIVVRHSRCLPTEPGIHTCEGNESCILRALTPEERRRLTSGTVKG